MTARRRTVALLTTLLGAIVLLSLMVGAVTAQTIRIGELNSYKDQPAFLGPYRNGMELAVEQINAAGGVNGKSLELIIRDDNGNPADAVRTAEELLSREKVDVLTGTFLSHVGMAVSDYARHKKRFFFGIRTPYRQAGLVRWQPLYLPSAQFHVHASGDVDP